MIELIQLSKIEQRRVKKQTLKDVIRNKIIIDSCQKDQKERNRTEQGMMK